MRRWMPMAVPLLIVGVFARSVSTPMRRIAELMNIASEEVAAASGQGSSASQSLAEGASQQAASIEETASSLGKWHR